MALHKCGQHGEALEYSEEAIRISTKLHGPGSEELRMYIKMRDALKTHVAASNPAGTGKRGGGKSSAFRGAVNAVKASNSLMGGAGGTGDKGVRSDPGNAGALAHRSMLDHSGAPEQPIQGIAGLLRAKRTSEAGTGAGAGPPATPGSPGGSRGSSFKIAATQGPPADAKQTMHHAARRLSHTENGDSPPASPGPSPTVAQQRAQSGAQGGGAGGGHGPGQSPLSHGGAPAHGAHGGAHHAHAGHAGHGHGVPGSSAGTSAPSSSAAAAPHPPGGGLGRPKASSLAQPKGAGLSPVSAAAAAARPRSSTLRPGGAAAAADKQAAAAKGMPTLPIGVPGLHRSSLNGVPGVGPGGVGGSLPPGMASALGAGRASLGGTYPPQHLQPQPPITPKTGGLSGGGAAQSQALLALQRQQTTVSFDGKGPQPSFVMTSLNRKKSGEEEKRRMEARKRYYE